jgi:hypothetical protein
MNRKRQLFDEASDKLREAMDGASGPHRAYLLQQVVELHRRSLEEPDEPLSPEQGEQAEAVARVGQS